VLTDIYALGVTCYRIINGDALLPQLADLSDLQDMVIQGKYPDRKEYLPYIPQALRRTVNRTMNVDPGKRFSSPSKFRRALENIQLSCDWEIHPRRQGTLYRTTCNNAVFRVRVIEDGNNHFSLFTTRQKGLAGKRKISKDCASDLGQTEIKKRLRRILTRIVREGK
jgi:serine/threonine protein kinase